MAIWVTKEPYQSDELIYGVENPKSAFLPTKKAFLEFFQENKSCLELNCT